MGRPRSVRSRRSIAALSAALLTTTVAAGLAATPADAATTPATAPGAPGVLSRFDLARKDCLGTARTDASKVWYTVAGGVLSDVYEPTIDNTNVQSLQYVVTDGRTFTDLQSRDLTYTVAADATGMACTVTATSPHGYRIATTYVTDPARDAVVMSSRLTAVPGSRTDVSRLAVFARLDAHVNGNGGGGSANGGADSGTVVDGVPVIGDENTVTQAANRDYGVPTYMALDSGALDAASVGYAGSASDGLTALDATHTLGSRYTSAPTGHVVATVQIRPHRGSGEFTLALGFGRTQAAAEQTVASSLSQPFGKVRDSYLAGWQAYDAGLHQPPASLPGLTADQIARTYFLDANVLRSSVDKTFPGAVAASLASPWGQAVSAGDLPGGKPVYFGSYREVFARDLYEAVTGFIASGDLATARAATRFLFERQQQPGGNMPRNSLLNGKVAPDTGGDQLDETAYPILMAYLTGLSGDDQLWSQHVKPAADYLVAHGPSFGIERWEEQSGYSPSTIAAEIAGLTAAAHIAGVHGDSADAQLYQAVADDFQRTIKALTVTHNGPYSGQPYFIRLSKNGNPNSEYIYNLGNGGPNADQRAIVDGGFQELVRLGELAPTDADVQNSLAVLDKQIAVSTPSGTGYYRYGTDAANGSADGYGDCAVPSQTSCTNPGQPWPTTNVGTGHLWPVLSGERAESALATGDQALALAQLGFLRNSASGIGLVPEQAWEDPDLAASPYGSDPTTASIGFRNGHAAGSASPLTWAQAQRLRLIADLGANAIADRPDLTTDRYVTHPAPAAVPVTITAPAAGSTVSGTATVTGTTTPGAAVVVSSIGTDTPGDNPSVATTAGPDGSFSADVPVRFGTNVLTVAATTADGTGTAHVSVTGQLVGGTTVLDVTDPTGDDNGPGAYQYPTSANFAPGAFDLTRFQVLTKDGTVYLRAFVRDLRPTFGDPLGAQLLDIYVHDPAATTTSTSASYGSRNYRIAAADAWRERVTVRGFAAPEWQDAQGSAVGQVSAVVATQATGTVTIALPEAQFGTPGSGWSFAVVLTGQDGYGTDGARNFTPTAGEYTFGVCALGGAASICSADPNTVPKALDVLTPAGVDQASELDPTLGPVAVRGVPVP